MFFNFFNPAYLTFKFECKLDAVYEYAYSKALAISLPARCSKTGAKYVVGKTVLKIRQTWVFWVFFNFFNLAYQTFKFECKLDATHAHVYLQVLAILLQLRRSKLVSNCGEKTVLKIRKTWVFLKLLRFFNFFPRQIWDLTFWQLLGPSTVHLLGENRWFPIRTEWDRVTWVSIWPRLRYESLWFSPLK